MTAGTRYYKERVSGSNSARAEKILSWGSQGVKDQSNN